MELLQVEFTPFEEDRFHFSIKVKNLTQGGEGYLPKVPLPFVDFQKQKPENWRFTLLKILESDCFSPAEFNAMEQQWMLSQGLLLQDRNNFPVAKKLLSKIGVSLFQSIFPAGSETAAILAASLNRIKADRTHLHIRFAFPGDAAKYARIPDYPWELLHDGQRFLGQDGATFSRYIENPDPAAAPLPPDTVNVLLVSSSAYDSENQLKKLPKIERQAIIESLRLTEAKVEAKIQLTVLENATFEELRKHLNNYRGNTSPHVLHFDGHGFFGRRCEICKRAYLPGETQCQNSSCEKAPLSEIQGYLVFEHDDREADYISATEFGELFGQVSRSDLSGESRGVTVAVLSACKSGMSLGSKSVFNGMAQNLIRNAVPAVVAMQYSVRVDAAKAFALYFYESLCQKDSLVRAVSLGRSAMGVEANQWYRPVLYLRWQDNEGGQLSSSLTQDRPELKLGAPFQAPALPESFIERSDIIQELKIRLFSQNLTLVISAIHGLGAVGKTTIAAALAHEPEIQKQFPDGILWTTLGQEPESKILQELGKWIKALGDRNFQAQSEQEASDHLRGILKDKKVLLIVDDAWNFMHAEHFKAGGSGCQMLVTTRDAGVAQGLKANVYPLDVMQPEEALELLRKKSNRTFLAEESEQAAKLAKAVGYLPLALELAAAQVSAGEISWCQLLQDLEQEVARLKSLDLSSARDYQNDDETKKYFSLSASLNLSIKCLNSSDKRDFIWLGITPDDTLLNPKMAKVIWSMEDVRDARELLNYLRGKALLMSSAPLSDGTPTYRMHDLVHDLARNLLIAPQTARRSGILEGLGVTLPEAHGELLERYRTEQKTPKSWHTLPNDSYIYQHLFWHLEKAGQLDEIHNLLAETSATGKNGWFEVREHSGNVVDFINDIMLAWQSIENRIDPQAIGLQLRYALIRTTILNTFLEIPSNLFAELVNENLWSIDDVLFYINGASDIHQRLNKLLDLLKILPEYQREILSCVLPIIGKFEETSVSLSRCYGMTPKDDVESTWREIDSCIGFETRCELINSIKNNRINQNTDSTRKESEFSQNKHLSRETGTQVVLNKLAAFQKVNDEESQSKVLSCFKRIRLNPDSFRISSYLETSVRDIEKNEREYLDEKSYREKIREINQTSFVEWDPFDDDPLSTEAVVAERLVKLIPVVPGSLIDEHMEDIRRNFHEEIREHSVDVDILDSLACVIHFLPDKYIIIVLSTIEQYRRDKAFELLISRIPDRFLPELLRYSTKSSWWRDSNEFFSLAIDEVVKRLTSMPLIELEEIWKDLVYGFSALTRPQLLSLIEKLGPVFYRLGHDDVLEEIEKSIQCVGKWWP